MFEIRDLKHAYDSTEVLSVSSWQVEQGSQWLVLGPSGSGKTTLLHVLAGILKPTAGNVHVAGQDIGALSENELDRFRGRHIGLVLQRLHLMASLTVMDNLLLAQYLAGLAQDRARAARFLPAWTSRRERRLSARAVFRPGAARRGRARRGEPAELLLADEPTSNLDDERCMQALGLLRPGAAYNALVIAATTSASRHACQSVPGDHQ
jgi:putative ABC transport system ATP-binding protein